MSIQDFKNQKNSLFQLVETWEENNIKLALQIIKKEEALKSACLTRYLPIIEFTGGKSLSSLKNLPKAFSDRILYSNEWEPTAEQGHILKTFPINRLKFFNYKYSKLPEWICRLNKLVKLEFIKNKLTHLPVDFGNLQKLEELLISQDTISQLPDSFGNLSSLRELYLNYNNLRGLPETFGDLKNLRLLYLNQNSSFDLPESFGSLSALRELVISCFDKKKIKFPVSMSKLSGLRELSIKIPFQKHLPDFIKDLKRLEKLNCNNTNITVLPEWIGALNELKILNIGANPLKSLPPSITELTALSELHIGRTAFAKEFPDKISGQENIQDFFKKIILK